MEMLNTELLTDNESALARSSYAPLSLLSPRAKQVLNLTCDGMSNEEIASALNIAPVTVKFHMKRIYDVFNATRRHTVIIEAIKAGVRPSWIAGSVSAA